MDGDQGVILQRITDGKKLHRHKDDVKRCHSTDYIAPNLEPYWVWISIDRNRVELPWQSEAPQQAIPEPHPVDRNIREQPAQIGPQHPLAETPPRNKK